MKKALNLVSPTKKKRKTVDSDEEDADFYMNRMSTASGSSARSSASFGASSNFAAPASSADKFGVSKSTKSNKLWKEDMDL